MEGRQKPVGDVIGLLEEHERTMAFAEVALGQIRSLRQTAVPRNYEIWYVYATGYNAALNKIINETLARHLSASGTPLGARLELEHIDPSAGILRPIGKKAVAWSDSLEVAQQGEQMPGTAASAGNDGDPVHPPRSRSGRAGLGLSEAQ